MSGMNCPSCGRSNRPGARFCGGCGSALAPRCPACGATADTGALFCDACGAPLADRPLERAISRKVVTVVFADLIGSVSLHERLDASVGRIFGTLRDGGELESIFVRLDRYEDGRNVGAELFELEDLERAKQRFAELGREHAQRRPESP